MQPEELHRALAKTPPRSAQVLSHRLIDDRSREDCAKLYGLTLAQWDVLFARSVNDFERALGRAPTAPDRLGDLLTKELTAVHTHREELKRLADQALRDFEASPSYTIEIWARRIAIVIIVALSIYFWMRPKEPSQRAWRPGDPGWVVPRTP